MPVAIACPKCQTRYSLPDKALGKPVKCKSCGAVFKTNAPKAAAAPQPQTQKPAQQPAQKPAQKPAQRAAEQPAQRTAQASNAELAKFGIDGPIGRPADIFAGAGAPSQMGNPLGNFVLEDPGFADLSVVHEAIQEEMGQDDDGMAGIINNPYLTSSTATAKGRKKAAPVDMSGYSVARVGMWMVYVAWGLTLGFTVMLFLLATFVRFVPEDTLRSIAQSMGETFFKLFLSAITAMFWIWGASVLGILVGQILCIFAPNKDEKLFAGLSVGSILAAFTLFIGNVILSAVGWNSNSDTQAVIGLMMLFVILGIYVLSLMSMYFFITYFKKIGKNIRAKDVVESSKTALLTWAAAIAIGIISGVAVGILTAIYAQPGEEPPEFLLNIRDISGLINVALAIAVMGTLLVMIRSAIDKTKAV